MSVLNDIFCALIGERQGIEFLAIDSSEICYEVVPARDDGNPLAAFRRTHRVRSPELPAQIYATDTVQGLLGDILGSLLKPLGAAQGCGFRVGFVARPLVLSLQVGGVWGVHDMISRPESCRTDQYQPMGGRKSRTSIHVGSLWEVARPHRTSFFHAFER